MHSDKTKTMPRVTKHKKNQNIDTQCIAFLEKAFFLIKKVATGTGKIQKIR
jgi:hypothetical protein